MRISLLSLGIFAFAVQFVAAQEVIDNPEFASWSKFPAGTSITLKVNSTVAGMTTETNVITKLVETGSEKLVLESSTVVKANGMEFKLDGQKRDVEKTIKLPEGISKENATKGKPEGTFEEGTEKLKIAGQEVSTQWYRYKTEADGFSIESKLWKSDDLPGLMVKMESTAKGAVDSVTKMELVEFKKP